MEKTLGHMTVDELVAEGGRTHAEMLALAERAQRIYDLLYHRAKKNPNAATSAYLNLANGGKRIAGLMSQGLKRAQVFERMLANIKTEMEITEREQREKQERKAAKAAKDGHAPPRDLLSELFGPDTETSSMLDVANVGNVADIDDLYGGEI